MEVALRQVSGATPAPQRRAADDMGADDIGEAATAMIGYRPAREVPWQATASLQLPVCQTANDVFPEMHCPQDPPADVR